MSYRAQAQFTMVDMADTMLVQATAPASPAVDQLWLNTDDKIIRRWTGHGTDTALTYDAQRTGAVVAFSDLSEDKALDVTVKAIAAQAGSGDPSPSNIRAISGKSSVKVRRSGKNLLDVSVSNATKNGVTLNFDVASGMLTLNGTCTQDNTVFSFLKFPAIPSSHVLAIHCVAGSIFSAGYTVVQLAEAGWANTIFAYLPTSGNNSKVANGPRVYAVGSIRVDSGTVLNNYQIKIQIELGTTATPYEPYDGSEITLTPASTLYGLTGAEDEIGNDGHESHKTKLVTFAGTESWGVTGAPNQTNTIHCQFNPTPSGFGGGVPLCSHLPTVNMNTLWGTDSIGVCLNAAGYIQVRVSKALAGSTLESFKAWLAAQNSAGTPVQVLYQLATPTTSQGNATPIEGRVEKNVIISDGASLVVGYTGTGWEKVQEAYQKVSGITIQPGLVEILGHVIRMITDQMYVSDTTDEATAALMIDALAKIVRANALQVKSLNLEGTFSGNNNVMLKGSDTVLNVPAGSHLPSIDAAIPKYLENDLTVYVATGTYIVGDWKIKNHTGGHIRWVFAAGVIILATTIELLNNPSGVSFVGDSQNYAQIIVTNQNNVIFGKRSGGEFAYLRLTGKVRTGAADGTAYGVQFEDCTGLYIHNNIVERTRLYTMFIDKCAGAYIVDNVGGYYQGDYTTLANTGEGVLILRGFGAVQNSVPMSNTNPVVSWLGTLQQYNVSQAASPGAPSAPATQTVKYVFNSNYYCDLPSSAGMSSAVADWKTGVPRGGISSTDRRYAGMWLLKLEGGAIQNILTGLTGKTILAANLTVHCDVWNGSGTGSKDLFYMLHGAAPPNGASTGSRLADTGYNLAPADGTTQTLNLTAWLQAMVNAGTAFYGFGIGTEGTYARYDSTCTLEITYQE